MSLIPGVTITGPSPSLPAANSLAGNYGIEVQAPNAGPSYSATLAQLADVFGASGVNEITASSYTVQNTDQNTLTTFSNAAPVAVTLPTAGASGTFLEGWFADYQNRGAGSVTITPTTSTIDGASSLVLNQNDGVRIFSDGTNYYTQRGISSIGAQTALAAAATTDLGSTKSGVVNVTGSGQSITSFGASASKYKPIYFVTFAASNTLVNSSSLVLLGSANIVTGTNDFCLMLYLGSGNWQMLSYTRAEVSP